MVREPLQSRSRTIFRTNQAVYQMKRIFAIIILITSLLSGAAQSAEGRYNSFRTRDGMLFFILPKHLKELSGIKRFEYDMTLLSWTDSVTVNFTFESNSVEPISDLHIVCGHDSLPCDSFSNLFVDAKKNHYEIRITSTFSFEEIDRMVKSSSPPRFCFRQGNVDEYATYSSKAWINDKKRLNDILKLFLLSK